ncbi:hypothetical protein QJS10_CPA02g01194 [Acorus calamus]|uniref:DUF1677 family protein n=1 Tax=Acorus calamus TaxID=4465 RepID=A0AAV9FD15_ACOCL|nr:hypothetical protein QJS10_CPA02g01194 [Acorus calamus]
MSQKTATTTTRSTTRRLSLDFFQRAVSDVPSEGGITKYMDLRLPVHSSSSNDIRAIQCECCGLSEDCTQAYIRRVRDRYCGRWVCGLCSEAVKEESQRLGHSHHIIVGEAVSAHMEICMKYNRTTRLNPSKSLARAMSDILKKSSSQKEEHCKIGRSYSSLAAIGGGEDSMKD